MAHLVLADVDLSGCLFTGTVHLDQVWLEGACSFDTVPPGTHWRRGCLARFTERRTLAEEHHWRTGQPAAARGWNVAVLGAGSAGPTQLSCSTSSFSASTRLPSSSRPGSASLGVRGMRPYCTLSAIYTTRGAAGERRLPLLAAAEGLLRVVVLVDVFDCVQVWRAGLVTSWLRVASIGVHVA
ncbi:hypothetical protein [Streptomyces tauricus]|uniref:hypothetical protein n=1 Tax=Streptomyces tauricus TaxID=68274 RepID=UPI003F4BCDC7